VELYLKQFQEEEVLRTLTLIRLGNLYGFTENPKKMHRGFFDSAIFDACQGREITCFGDGNFLRDFIHIDDLIAGILAFIESSTGTADGMFNLAGGTGHTLKEALNTIGELLISAGKGPMRIKYQDFPLNAYDIEKRNHVADISLVKKSINWIPTISLTDGISRSINYYSSINLEND
jgi:nucleoside-diphosphate-sugar epimerase